MGVISGFVTITIFRFMCSGYVTRGRGKGRLVSGESMGLAHGVVKAVDGWSVSVGQRIML